MVKSSRRAPRGQSMVETALGTLVFITILMFGIHFAEVGYLSVKVQEAAASALWDTTGAKMHELPGDFGSLDNAINGAGGHTTQRYQDFDGRSSKPGGSTPVQVYTAADGLRVECSAADGISYQPSSSTGGVYVGRGGMSCVASAAISPSASLTRSFLDQGEGSLFQVTHYAAGVIRVCGTGRANGGNCSGGFGILLDDWGLAGADESRECNVLDRGNCSNKAYYDSANSVFGNHGWSQGGAEALARGVVGQAPITTSTFFMSFKGMDSNFRDRENGGDSDPNNWVTTPGAGSPTTEYADSFSNRGNCFLGVECP